MSTNFEDARYARPRGIFEDFVLIPPTDGFPLGFTFMFIFALYIVGLGLMIRALSFFCIPILPPSIVLLKEEPPIGFVMFPYFTVRRFPFRKERLVVVVVLLYPCLLKEAFYSKLLVHPLAYCSLIPAVMKLATLDDSYLPIKVELFLLSPTLCLKAYVS